MLVKGTVHISFVQQIVACKIVVYYSIVAVINKDNSLFLPYYFHVLHEFVYSKTFLHQPYQKNRKNIHVILLKYYS